MELVVDQLFRETYTLYYKDQYEGFILERINDTLSKYDPEIVCDTINIIKASIVTGAAYTDTHDRIVVKILNRFPSRDDIDLFILNITLKVLIAFGTKDIEDLMSRPRDIYKEATARHFKIPLVKVTEDMIEAVKKASDNFKEISYTVVEEPTESWDEYFYNVCIQIARHSKCLSRKIGAVLVQDKSIISTGYNGPPRGVPRCDMRWEIDKAFHDKYEIKLNDASVVRKCPRKAMGSASGQDLNICVATHAEVNSLISAARNGIRTKDSTMYMTCSIPCSNCLKEIINAGVKELVVASLDVYDDNAMYLLNNSNLEVRLYDFIK